MWRAVGEVRVADELLGRSAHPPALQEGEEDNGRDGDDRKDLLESVASLVLPDAGEPLPDLEHDPLVGARTVETLLRAGEPAEGVATPAR